jgi:hypothetical protein
VRCYLPRTGTILVAIATLIVLLHGPAGHAIAAVGEVTAALAVSALAAGTFTGITIAARAQQRRRALAGGCPTCRFDCQYQTLTGHGVTGATRRPMLVTIHTRALAPGAAQDQERAWPDRELVRG